MCLSTLIRIMIERRRNIICLILLFKHLSVWDTYLVKCYRAHFIQAERHISYKNSFQEAAFSKRVFPLFFIMIEWKRKIFFLEFALQMSTFLADIYIMIELKQEIFCLYLHYRHSLFSWHLYYDRVKARNLFSWICTTNVHIYRWHLYYDRVKVNNNFSFTFSFNIPYNLFHSLSYVLQNKKAALLSQDG